ncbi:MAG: D-alanine--D-alanine ligase [Clostridia bacterium]|nr:D-alanine--D-alanine ligase [Clostridia bacterium]
MNLTNGKRKIALLYGGRGCEHSVSIASAEYVWSVIDRRKYELLCVFIDKAGAWWLSDGVPSPSGHDTYRASHKREVFPCRAGELCGLFDGEKILPVDCAIPLLHGDYGEDGRIQGALDSAGIPFTGADVITGAVCIDKGFTRALAEQIGIPTARGVSLPRAASLEDAARAARQIGFPVFVKPRRLGSSVGAGAARDEAELTSVFRRAALYGEVLIEEFIDGKRELEIGALFLRGRHILSPVGEVLCNGFYDFDKKYGGSTQTVCPADISGGVAEKIREYAVRLCEAASLCGTARIDFFLSDGRLLFNEINTLPGFTKDSLYPALMRAAGIDEGELFNLLVEDAANR